MYIVIEDDRIFTRQTSVKVFSFTTAFISAWILAYQKEVSATVRKLI